MSKTILTNEQLDALRKKQNQQSAAEAGAAGRSVPSVERLEELRKNQGARTVPSEEKLNQLRSGNGTGSAGSAQGSKTDSGSAGSEQWNKTGSSVQAEELSWRALAQKRQAAAQNPYAEALEGEKKKGFFSALGENFVQGTRQAVWSIDNALMESVARAYDPETNASYRLANRLTQTVAPNLMKATAEGIEETKKVQQGLRAKIEENTALHQQEQKKVAEKYDSGDLMTKAGQIIGQGVGSMVPAAAAGLVAGPVGSSLAMFGQGYGQGYVSAKQDGATEEQAHRNAVGSGLVSAGVEAISGSIGGLRLPGGSGVVDDLVSGFIDSNVKNKTLNQLAKYLADATGEGLEEVAEDLLQPLVEKLSYGKKTGVEKLVDGETTLGEIGAALGEDFLGGFLTSAFLGGAQKLGQTVAGAAGNAGQNAAQVQQDTGNDARMQQTGRETVSAAENAQNRPDTADVKNDAGMENAAQTGTEPVLTADKKVDKVKKWADENDGFTPQMKSVAKSNYLPGTNENVYMGSMQSFYDAGRGGVLSYEQVSAQNAVRAAVLNNEPALRAAFELGRGEVTDVRDAAGQGAVQGKVLYEEGTTPGVVLSESVVQAVADKLGVNIRVVRRLTDAAGGEANGHWAAALSQIALGENSSNGYQTLVHELTHYMGSYNEKGWNDLRNAALNWYAANGKGVDAALSMYGELYGNYTMGVDEAARDVLSGVMSTEEGTRSFLEYITRTDEYTVQEKRSVLQALRDMLDKLVEQVRTMLHGGESTRMTMDARRAAERADMMESRKTLVDAYLQTLEGARENARSLQDGAVNENVQAEQGQAASKTPESYSKKADADGKPFVEIDEDILAGVEEKDVVRTVRNELKKRFPNGFVRNGWKIELTNKGIKEFTSSKGSKRMQYLATEDYKNKLRSAANMDEIIDLAENYRREDPMHERKDDLVKFGRADVRIRVGGEDYTAELITGIRKDSREMFYDLVNLTPTKIKMPTGKQASAKSDTDTAGVGRHPYDNSILRNEGDVNGKSVEEMQENEGTEAGVRESRKSAAAEELEFERKQRRRAETENARLARENSRMEDQIELLKQETKLSGGRLMDPEAVKAAARELVKEYSSKYDPDVLERELRHAFEAMARNTDSESGLNVNEAMVTLTELARGVIEQSRQLDTDASEAYKPVKDVIRGMAWTVRKNSNTYYDLLDAFGDGENGKKWGNVRRALFSRLDVKLVDENGPAGTFDTNFETLARDFPGEFDSESDAETNVRRVLEVYELAKPQLVNQYGNDLDGAANFAAQKLYQQYLAMPRRKTFADKNMAGADELARRYNEQLEQALAEQKTRYEERLKELKRTEGRWVQAGILEKKAALELRWEKKEQRAQRTKARDSVQKSMTDLYRWVTKPTAQDHVQTRMQKTVLDLLNAIDPNDSRTGTKSYARWQEVMKDLRNLASDSMKADAGTGETDAYADFDPDLPGMIDALVNGYESVKVKDLDSKGMKQLADILTTVKTSIRNANRMMMDSQNRAVAEIAQKSAAEMEDEKDTLVKQRSRLAKKAGNSWLGVHAEKLFQFDMMDARRYFKTLGETAQKSVYEPIRRGFDKRVWLLEEAQKQFEAIKGDTDVSKWTGDKAEKQHFRFANGAEADLTVGQMMELYNLSQRQQAHDHLIQGGIVLVDQNGRRQQERITLTPGDLARVTGALTPEQVKMAKKMSQYLSDRNGPAGWGNEVSQKMYGLDKFTEKNYWPIRSDNNQTRTSDATAGNTASLWALKNQGFTKNLTINANNSVMIGDAFDTWSNHVANMATYNSMVIPLSDAMKWFNWRDGVDVSTKEQIQNLCGEAGKSYFITLMQDINGMSAKPNQTGFAAITAKMTRNWKIAKVGANLRVAVQQPTAYLRAGAEMSPKYLMGALTVDVKKMKHGMEMAENHCAIAKWKSWGYFETGIGRSMKDVLTGQGNFADSLREKSNWMAEMGDRMTWGTLWNACELEARDKGLQEGSEEFTTYCADRLSDIVDKTQVVDTVLHRSQLMRNKDSVSQMETNFFAEPTKTYNMVMEAVVDAAHGKKGAGKKLGRVAATYFVTALGTAAAASLVDAVRVKDDDRDKDFEERYTKAFWENFAGNVNFLNNIPLVKDALNAWNGFDNVRTDIEALSDTANALEAILKYFKGKSKSTPYKMVNLVANAFSSLTGLPAATALREAKSLYDMVFDLQDPLRIDRQFGRKEGDYTYDDLFNHVKQADGDTKAFRALYNGKTYQDMLGSEQAADVDSWTQALAKETAVTEEDGTVKENTAVLARHLGNVITYEDADGNSRKIVLNGNEYLSYAGAVQRQTVELLDEYRKGTKAGSEQQTDFAQMAREYAVECAREELIAGYKLDNWVQTVREMTDDMGTVQALKARQIVKDTKADVDEDGNTVPGSKAANTVQALRSAGYDAAQAQALYAILSGTDDSQYLKLYRQVKKEGGDTDLLAALFGVSGETASYAAMTGKKDAGKVDVYLKGLSMSDGKDVLPDHVAAAFSYTVDGVKHEVELKGKDYLGYAQQRTETAYDLTALFMPEADSYDSGLQADLVGTMEEYANQTAKASYSGYETSSWVQKIQDEAGVMDGNVNGEVYALLLARALINSSTGYKGANGKTVSGSKKKEAIGKLQDAGYKKAYAEELYKLFG